MADTPYMALEIGVPGVTVGPAWAELIERNKDDIDVHDHSTGKGVQVPTAGILIDDEMDFNANGILDARVVQLSSAGLSGDRSVLYRDSYGDLHWVDDAGADVPITSGGSLAVSTLSNGFWSTELKSASFILSGSNKTLIRVNTAGGARTITLPAASAVTAGQFFVIVDIGSGANNIVFDPDGTDKINGYNGDYTARCTGGVMFLTNLDGVDDWSVSSPLNGTINDSAITAGNYMRRKAGTPNEYEFVPVDLTDDTNGVSGRLKPGNMSQATSGAEGIVQLTADFGGSSTSPTVLFLSASSGTAPNIRATANLRWAAAASNPKLTIEDAAGAATDLYILGQATSGVNDGGRVFIRGGDATGTGSDGAVVISSGSGGLAVQAFATREVVSVGNASPASTDVPGGDGVLYLANATTAPSNVNASERPIGGLVVYSDAGYLAWKVPNGQTTKLRDLVVPGVSGSWANFVAGSGGDYGYIDTVIDGTSYRIPVVVP